MDIAAWQATVHGVTKSWIRLSDEHTHTQEQWGPLVGSFWGRGDLNCWGYLPVGLSVS